MINYPLANYFLNNLSGAFQEWDEMGVTFEGIVLEISSKIVQGLFLCPIDAFENQARPEYSPVARTRRRCGEGISLHQKPGFFPDCHFILVAKSFFSPPPPNPHYS
jgi:hypothetical protein